MSDSTTDSAPEIVSRSGAYSSFWPLTLLAVSLLVVLGWELNVASEQRSNGEKMRDQQAKSVEQSKQVQLTLEKLARDLIELSATDDDAKAIVKKFGIAVNATAPAASASPAPSATP